MVNLFLLTNPPDLIRVYHSSLYIVEGYAACQAHLRETEEDLLLRLGAPDRRNYAKPETIEYDFSFHSCQFILQNGYIREICLILRSKKERLPSWSTQSSLYEDDLKDSPKEELIKKLIQHYKDKFLLLKDKITFPNKGVSFSLKDEVISSICVFLAKKVPKP